MKTKKTILVALALVLLIGIVIIIIVINQPKSPIQPYADSCIQALSDYNAAKITRTQCLEKINSVESRINDLEKRVDKDYKFKVLSFEVTLSSINRALSKGEAPSMDIDNWIKDLEKCK